MQFSQTQLSNIATFAGLLVIILAKFGVKIGTEELTFLLGATISIGFTIYNYYQRWKRGDLTLGGFRK